MVRLVSWFDSIDHLFLIEWNVISYLESWFIGMNVEQQTQPNEQDVGINLSGLRKDLLKRILIHLDDKELLNASHVCKSFEEAAEMAFAQKYTNKSYNVDEMPKSFDKVMLT